MNAVHILYFRDARVLYGQGLSYATPGSVGLDLRACPEAGVWKNDEVWVEAGARLAVPTGIAVEPLLPGVAGFVYSRSGLGAVKGLTVAQGVGVIDPDYRGEICVWLLNTSGESLPVRRGDRVAQLLFQPVVRLEPQEVSSLGETIRGSGGFGHSGLR